MKEKLTDYRLKKMPPAQPGKRVMVWDTEVGNFGVRVTDRVDPVTKEPSRTFVVMRRLGAKLVRHKVGTYPSIGLQQAREAAREANFDFERGIDPSAKKKSALAADALRNQTTFDVVTEAFIKRHLPTIRSGKEAEASIRRELLSRWSGRPVTEITASDIIYMVEEILDSGRPAAAHKMYGHASKLFGWAVARKTFGLVVSPAAGISTKEIFGRTVRRQRVLNDGELRTLWKVLAELGSPLGPFGQMLLLTGQRLREVANATWAEIDLDQAMWTIPSSRMKGDSAHEVPLSPMALEIFRALPRFDGPYVFSTTGGKTPISGFSKFKDRIDAALPADMPAWVFHDLRRTMRTRLSGLPIPHNVAELVIAHAQPELDKVYDQHRYGPEKRRALTLWADKLATIIGSGEGRNVVHLAAAS